MLSRPCSLSSCTCKSRRNNIICNNGYIHVMLCGCRMTHRVLLLSAKFSSIKVIKEYSKINRNIMHMGMVRMHANIGIGKLRFKENNIPKNKGTFSM